MTAGAPSRYSVFATVSNEQKQEHCNTKPFGIEYREAQGFCHRCTCTFKLDLSLFYKVCSFSFVTRLVLILSPLMTDVRCALTFCSSLQPMGTASLGHPFTQNMCNDGDCTCATLLLTPPQSGADAADLQRDQTRPFHTAL